MNDTPIKTRDHVGQFLRREGAWIGFLQKVMGYSRIHVTWFIHQYVQTGPLPTGVSALSRGFAIPLPWRIFDSWGQAEEWHEKLSGPATKKLCNRAW